MKNAIKLFGIIALVAVIGFSMVACGGDDDGDNNNNNNQQTNQPSTGPRTLSGTVTAKEIDTSGIYYVSFRYTYNPGEGGPTSCTFTTDLPSPNDSFTLEGDESLSLNTYEWDALTAGKVVNWTATVTTNKIEIDPETPSGYAGSIQIFGRY